MGIISTKAHTVIGILLGVVLLFASSIFGFADVTVAAMVALWVGVFIIASELTTTSPYSPLRLVPMRAHIVVDVMTGIFLILSPWLFGFFDTAAAMQWLPHVLAGIVTAGYALLTTTADEKTSVAAQ